MDARGIVNCLALLLTTISVFRVQLPMLAEAGLSPVPVEDVKATEAYQVTICQTGMWRRWGFFAR